MRRLLFILTILFSAYVSAEDIIVTRSSQRIRAIIEEVGPDYIKYHQASNPNGPIIRLEACEIATIIYGNGDVQTFDDVAPLQQEPTAPANTSPQQQQPSYGQQPYMYPVNPLVDYRLQQQMRKDSIRTAKKEAFRVKMDAIPRSHFVLANYSYSFNKSHNVGLTYGWCHAVGVSINAMLGVSGFHYSPDDYISSYGDYSYSHRLLTNNHTHQRISFAPGLLVRLGCPLYFNVGLGYAYESTTYRATTGEWIRWGPYEANCITSQFGLWGNIKGVSFSLAYAGYGWEDRSWVSEVMVGVGFSIPAKKGGQK